jgi:ATP-binding cassette, subfamily F, member 3
MTLLSLAGVTVQYGANVLLQDVTLTIARGEHWGMIGRNGSGKTSLFRMITGDLDPAQGGVSRAPGMRVAVLDQHRDFGGAATVWDAACAPFADLLKLEHSLQEQGEAIANLGDRLTPEHLDRYDRDLERFRREGGYEMEARVSAILHGLGFDPDASKVTRLETLSGGERGRLGLACQLVTNADLLLLDEPTNHLDLETTAWLVDHLRGLDSSTLIISHDRAFLDAVADHIIHLEAGTGFSYEGNYSSFIAQREERRLASTRAYAKQAKFIAKEEDYIRRHLAGQNTNQAKGRRKKLTHIARLSPPPGDEAAMAVRFKSGGRGGDQVLIADQLKIQFDDRVLLDGFSGVLRRGDVLGLIGPNGAGKSTLLATLLGDRQPDGGTLRLGDTIDVEVYRQDMRQVPRDKSLFDIIHDMRPTWTRGQVMDHLGRFDFSGDEQLRKASGLSGGELARVALAMMTLAQVNLLVFDEPTNHLDVESIEALEDAIERYEGTVLLVSHDRALLSALCTRIWHLDQGRIADFDGSFSEWEENRDEKKRVASVAHRESEAARKAKAKVAAPGGEEERKKQQNELRTARRTLEQAEMRVQQLEREAEGKSDELADPALYNLPDGNARAAKIAKDLEGIRTKLAQAFSAWESAAADVERLAE